MIKTAFFEDAKLGREDDPLMLVIFIGTWVLADDEGNLPDDSAFLRSYILPYTRRFTPEDVGSRIDRLCELRCIIRYEACGERYLHVVNFKKHQTLKKPTQKHPIPTNEQLSAALGTHRCGTSGELVAHQSHTNSAPASVKGRERTLKEAVQRIPAIAAERGNRSKVVQFSTS